MSSSMPIATSHNNQRPTDSNSNPKTDFQIPSKPIPAIPAHVVTELQALWSSDPRVPSASSRRKWSALRQVDPAKIGGWFSRRKLAAKKAGNPISEDTYELSLDPPPPPPPPESPAAPILVLSDLQAKKEFLPGPSPSARRRGRPRKKIKIEELSSDDTAYNSASTPISDDHGTLIASDDETFVPSMRSLPESSKESKKPAYSHFSQSQSQLQDTLFSPASATANTLAYDHHLPSPSSLDYDRSRGLVSYSPAPTPSAGRQNSVFPQPVDFKNPDSKTQELATMHQKPPIRDPTRTIRTQVLAPKTELEHKLESDTDIQTSSSSGFACTLYDPSFAALDDQFPPSNSSELPLSALLSSDILFELLPFSSDSQRTTASDSETAIPVHVPTTDFSSIAFLYRLPNFTDVQTQTQTRRFSTDEYLTYLAAQLPLSDPKCDLSSFDSVGRR